MKQCQICLQTYQQNAMYGISNCQHIFCLECCMNQIKSRSQNFSEVRCPGLNCPGIILPLEKLSIEIKNNLTAKTLQQLEAYAAYRKLQQNPNLKPCSIPNCEGFIDLRQNKKICSICNQPHCPKCLKTFHNGACILDEHDQYMRRQNFQKCPNCFIWVEKMAGCHYIDCKCGTAFCYNCGIRFQQDPCRMNSIWGNEMKIRKAIQNIKYELPLQKQYYILLPAKLLIQFIAFLLLTIIGSLIFTLMLLLGLALLIIISPIIALAMALTSKGLKKVLLLLVFPLLAVCLSAFFITALFLYPFCRKRYHHGLYDGLDTFILKIGITYLQIVSKILRW